MSSTAPAHFYTRFRGRVEGPYSGDDLLMLARSHRISSLAEVSTDQKLWRRFRDWDQLNDIIREASSPPASGGQGPSMPTGFGPSAPSGVAAGGGGGGAGGMGDAALGAEWLPDPERRDARAVYGLVCSSVGLVTLGLLCPLGVFLSLMSLSSGRDRSFSIAGALIGSIGTAAWLAFLIVRAVWY